MVRSVINILSPIAALAVVWVSLQSFVITGQGAPPAEPLLVPPTSVVSEGVLPELGSVSHVLATTSTESVGGTVPEAVRRILITNGVVLLVPERAGGL